MRLRVLDESAGTERVVELGGFPFTIGRARDNVLQLTDPNKAVSKYHARVVEDDGRVCVVDMESQNGTMLNDQVLAPSEPAECREGDCLRIGPFLVEFVGDGSSAAVAKTRLPSRSHPAAEGDEMFSFMRHVHELVLERTRKLKRTEEELSPEEFRDHVRQTLTEVLDDATLEPPQGWGREALMSELLDYILGLGPLERLLADDTVTEIMVNQPDEIYIERKGKIEQTRLRFFDDNHISNTIQKIIQPLARRIDESVPYVNARLADGSRVHAIIPPLAVNGPVITIRKFSKHKLTIEDLMRFGALNESMAQFLETMVKNRASMIISGGTGSGKTTLLNVLSNFIPDNERIITVEDSAELRLNKQHVISLEARFANIEGKGEVTIRDLVRETLRMRPDRIVVGECRGGEALDMLQAMNTGHDGSLTTLHANTPRDTLSRLETMVLMAEMDLPSRAIRDQIAAGIHFVVQTTRLGDGSRKITSITEITGLEENSVFTTQDVFLYKQQGFDPDGKVVGRFEATGIVPRFIEQLRERGVKVNMGMFQ